MATFLTKAQIARILARELPEDFYPDGAESDYVSTAELGSIAQCLSSAYSTMESISLNHFPQTTDEKLADWEITVFGRSQIGTGTDEERRGALLAFLRAENNLSYWTILTSIIAMVPVGIVVEIRPRSYAGDPVTADIKGDLSDLVWGPDWTSGDPAPAGVTVTDAIRNNEADLLAVRTQAYRYTVVVWGGSISDDLKALIEEKLSVIEPARCAHDLLFLTEALLPGTLEIDEFNAEASKAAYADATSNTGYRAPLAYYFGFDGDDYAAGFADALIGTTGTSTPGGFFYPLL